MSANSTGTATATAGNVNIVTGELAMQSGSITTESTLADGGNISITTTGSTVVLTNSQITTSVASGTGSGGNITVGSGTQPFDLILLNDSQIRADAFGGPGGNINIFANIFLPSDSIISASSALSTPGVIDIQAVFTDVSGSVAPLPEKPLQATELMRASCAARFAGGKTSSLVAGGRDGVPIQPGGLLPSPLYSATAAGTSVTDVKTSGNDVPARFSLLGPVDSMNRRLIQYSLLPNVKCAF
jgi:large exoprotein involved in heme utilization and adhesion